MEEKTCGSLSGVDVDMSSVLIVKTEIGKDGIPVG
jgi:hypothetical protein